MAKQRLVAIVAVAFSTLTAVSSGWAETPSPSLVATPPQPKWSELTVQQKIVLAPLADDWDSMEYYRQKKWLGIFVRFPAMTAEEQRRIQGQMQEWGKLTPEQRRLARENYKNAQQLSPEKKQELKQKWEEYSNLPEEEKARLKQQAQAAKPTRPILALPALSPVAQSSAPPLSATLLPGLAPPALTPVPAATNIPPQTSDTGSASTPAAETTSKP